MADEDNIVTHKLLGRDMQFRPVSPGQLVLISRMAQRAMRQVDEGETVAAFNSLMVKMLDLIESLFVSEQDRQDVEDAMLAGKISLEEVQSIAFGGKTEPAPDDADPVVAPKTLRSKRPAAVAKVAKKTANPRRAAR